MLKIALRDSPDFIHEQILNGTGKKERMMEINPNLPDLGAGFCWSSITCSKNRFLSETVLGVLADGGGVGDWKLSWNDEGKK